MERTGYHPAPDNFLGIGNRNCRMVPAQHHSRCFQRMLIRAAVADHLPIRPLNDCPATTDSNLTGGQSFGLSAAVT